MELQNLLECDKKIVEWVNQHRIKLLDPFFIFITDTAYATAVLIAVTILCIALYGKNKILQCKAVQIATALISNSVVVTLLKYTVNRERPFVNDAIIEKLSSGGSPSFPSGHTADAFVVGVSVMILFKDKVELIILAWCWAVAVAYSRVVLGVHYVSDVIVSAIIGSIIAIIINKIFRKKMSIKCKPI